MIGVDVSSFYDPARPDPWTAAFQDALATGRTVLVPAGDYDLTKGALPVLASGQRIVGEGATLARLHFRGSGDAIRLSGQVDSNYHWPSGLEHVSIYGRDAGNGAGVVMLGGVGHHIRSVVVGGFQVCIDLDGAECCNLDDITLWSPYADSRYPDYGIRFCEGTEGGRGWTVPGATNCNRIRGLSVISGATIAAVRTGGVSNTISGFNSNAGGWQIRGNDICLEHGSFEIPAEATECLLVSGGGMAVSGLYADDIQVTRGPLVRIASGTTVYGLALDRIQSQGAHILECGDAYCVAGWARISGQHWGNGTGTRAANIDQPYADNVLMHVGEYSASHRKIGIGTMQPEGALLDVRNPGLIPGSAQVRYGGAVKWEIREP